MVHGGGVRVRAERRFTKFEHRIIELKFAMFLVAVVGVAEVGHQIGRATLVGGFGRIDSAGTISVIGRFGSPPVQTWRCKT